MLFRQFDSHSYPIDLLLIHPFDFTLPNLYSECLLRQIYLGENNIVCYKILKKAKEYTKTVRISHLDETVRYKANIRVVLVRCAFFWFIKEGGLSFLFLHPIMSVCTRFFYFLCVCV